MWKLLLWMGVLIAGPTLGIQGWAIAHQSENWGTMAFTVLTLAQLVNAMAVRTETESLFSLGLLSNKPLLATVSVTLVLQLAVICLEPLQRLFHTAPLTSGELAICLLLSLVVLAATEADKWRCRSKRRP